MADEGQVVFNMLMKFISESAATTKNLSQALNEFLRTTDLWTDPKAPPSISYCNSEYLPEVVKEFEKRGIKFAIINETEHEGISAVMFPRRYETRAQEAIASVLARHCEPGLIDKQILNEQADGDLRRVDGLSYTEAFVYAEHARQAGINISLENPDPDIYSVIYNADNQDVLREIKSVVAVEMAGKAGEALTKQIEYENKNFERIKEEVMRDLTKESERFYIVDLSGREMCITENGAEYKGPEGSMSVSRDNVVFEEMISALYTQMENPVDLSQEEFEKYGQSERELQKELIKQKDRENGRPVATPEEKAAVEEIYKNHDLYEQKLNQGVEIQNDYTYALTNNEMRMETYIDLEKINEEMNHDRNAQELNEELLDDARSIYKGYKDKEDIRSYETEYFAEQIEQGLEPEMDYSQDEIEHNDYIDRETRYAINDVNDNYVPDDLEEDVFREDDLEQ